MINDSISPNFLIIGANKGGTTSLFQYLIEHPEIFKTTVKEPMFFNHYNKQGADEKFRTVRVIKSLESYKKLFKGSENFKAAGESSTSYLANPNCAANIYDFNPEMKLIAILRNPVERAFSNYLMYVRWGEETRTFTQALQDELNGKDLPQGKQYIYLGRYLKSLQIYKALFKDKQLKIFLNEDMRSNLLKTYQDICCFLDVSADFEPNFKKKYNTNASVEIRPFHKFLKKTNKIIPYTNVIPSFIKNYIFSKPKMKKKDKMLLQSLYKDEIEKLSIFLDRDLSNWLK
ncbi:sulfotransferase domain-containing protein [Lacinutrix jangbogonensis]|uniref:sulfotransferase domain-containing protein n=1 Tax=Lacinutrix jangbogonensis TaxID=1469557 RepID=UPI00053E9445|nr:sulfotransferase domain-containing protein [Lacinutrix jangbogonensis]